MMEIAWEWHMPVEELAERMSTYELQWWKAFLRMRKIEMDDLSAGRERDASPAKTAGFT